MRLSASRRPGSKHALGAPSAFWRREDFSTFFRLRLENYQNLGINVERRQFHLRQKEVFYVSDT
jgi:hypothetical protein